MIEIKDIMGATCAVLKDKFPQIERETKDLEEGFDRPCFYVELDGDNSSQIGESVYEDSLIIRITYFPEEKKANIKELLNMREALRKAFGLKLRANDDFYIPINEKSFDISSNKILVLDMPIIYYHDIEDIGSEYELLENLDFEVKGDN